MKKIININLSGRVIPIEDSAYEKLQAYIESLRRYFSNEEGRDEIINDIESRIAELMNERIRKGFDSVTDADIEEIVASMGRPEDFDAAENETISAGAQTQQSRSAKEEPKTARRKNRLYRDSSDKILGGVASGLANYLDVDPAVIRILLILFGFTGTGVLLYIILWMVLPARDLNDYVGKRLFRNSDDKVIAGVAGGLATYFNKPAWIIRLILVSPILLNVIFGTFNGIFFSWHRDIFPNVLVAPFTGTFILAYIILWMVLPEARSEYEKMEMRGEKVDVNSIRQNVKERAKEFGDEVKSTAQNFSNKAKEFANTRGKAWASEVAETARPAARGIGHIIGVIFKSFFIFIAGCIALSLFAALIVLIFGGVTSWPVNNFLWTSSYQKFLAWGTLLFFITVPVVGFMTWLIRRIVRVRSRGNHLGWIFGGLWLLGWICAIAFAASIAKDLRVYDRTNAIDIPITQPQNGKLIVRVNEPEIRYSGTIWWVHDDNSGWDITDDTIKYNNVKLRIGKSEDSFYHVRVFKYSAGRNLNDAQQRAAKTGFNVVSQDSFLNLSSGLTIDKNSKFRGQGVLLEIAIPAGKKIRFNESLIRAYNPWVVRRVETEGHNWGRRWQSDWDYDEYFDWDTDIDYVMGADGKLFDPSKPEKKGDENGDYRNNKNKRNKREKELQDELRKIQEQDRLDSIQRRLDSIQKRSEGFNDKIIDARDNTGSNSRAGSANYIAIFSFTSLFN